MAKQPSSILDELATMPSRRGNGAWHESLAPEVKAVVEEIKTAHKAKPRTVVWSLQQAYDLLRERYGLTVKITSFRDYMRQ